MNKLLSLRSGFWISPFLPVLLTSFSLGIEKVMYFSAISPKQVNCPLTSSASSFIIS